MTYKVFNSQKKELQSRIKKIEAEHFLMTTDLKIAEEGHDPSGIAKAAEKLTHLDATLKVLYDELQSYS